MALPSKWSVLAFTAVVGFGTGVLVAQYFTQQGSELPVPSQDVSLPTPLKNQFSTDKRPKTSKARKQDRVEASTSLGG